MKLRETCLVNGREIIARKVITQAPSTMQAMQKKAKAL
jgi:hypothetical protein